MKKLLIACAAVMATCFAMTGAMAATFDLDKDTVSLEEDISSLSGQVTVIITEAEEIVDETSGEVSYVRPTNIDDTAMILYIDQTEQGANIFQDMAVKGELEEGKTYVIQVGGENYTSDPIITDFFTITSTPTVVCGDVDGNGTIANLKDANYLKRYVAKWTGYDALIILDNCDIDGNGVKGNLKDANYLKRRVAKWTGYTGDLPITSVN